MAKVNWAASGDYLEACSCTFLCPCIATNLMDPPTGGLCKAALLFHIKKGHYGRIRLDDLCCVVVGRIPNALIDGNWSVGLIVDDRANEKQREAITIIMSGKAGGPMARFAHLVGDFLGVEAHPIRFSKKGMKFSFEVPGVLVQEAEGVKGGEDPNKPLYVDNNKHWANKRLGLARPTKSHLKIFGIDWHDESGRNTGVMTTFNWVP
jgi:hypothetical protein